MDCASGETRLEEARGVLGPVDDALRLGAGELNGAPAVLYMGAGALGRAAVPGGNRLIVCGASPAWQGFYVSTMGSAALPLRGLGLDGIVLHGRSHRPALLTLRSRTAPAEVTDFGDAADAWRPVPDGSGRPGTYAILERLHAGAGGEPLRALVTGPAAAVSRSGALASAVGRDAEVVLETWAGRGGMGSALLQRHGLLGVVFAGVPDPPPPVQLDLDPDDVRRATAKYRYDPQLRTGGTLGANLSRLGPLLLSFNWASVGWPLEVREGIHQLLVAGHYLRQYDDEIVRPRRFRDCGETCPAVCKKVGSGGFKKDYQPYAALGPNAGIFDQRAAESLTDHADAMGFDSVDLGGLVAWLLECMADDLVQPSELGVDPADVRFPRQNQVFDPARFDAIDDSHAHARAGRAIVDALVSGRVSWLTGGIRAAANHLGGEARARAAYVAQGDSGGLSPAQYWVPGMVAPVAMSGKYWVDYGFEWRTPRELGLACAERMTRELALDNLGLCRFQREWAEERLDELLARATDGDRTLQELLDGGDVFDYHRRLAAEITAAAAPRPWETRRVREHVAGYVEEIRALGPREQSLEDWTERLRSSRDQAIQAYWEEMRHGIHVGLG